MVVLLELLAREVLRDLTHDGVIFDMNHHLILILAKALDRVAHPEVAVKNLNHALLGKFTL